MKLRNLEERDLIHLKKWLTDKLTKKYVSYECVNTWYQSCKKNPFYHNWIAYEDSHPIGVVSIEEYKPSIGAISIIVNPDFRGQGKGAKILKLVLMEEKLQEIKTLEAYIDQDNFSSIRCFEKADFLNQGLNEDNLYKFLLIK